MASFIMSLALAFRLKSLSLALRLKSLALRLKSLALEAQVLGPETQGQAETQVLGLVAQSLALASDCVHDSNTATRPTASTTTTTTSPTTTKVRLSTRHR